MKDLIEALTILMKYGDSNAPTRCEHNVALTDEWAKRFIREVGEKNQ